MIGIHCDKTNWLPTDVIIASEDPAVSAQWGIGDQTDDGYTFWFLDPCGSYMPHLPQPRHQRWSRSGQRPARLQAQAQQHGERPLPRTPCSTCACAAV
ncbi:MAG: hypothetical protein U0V45_05185 [Flavobacteriales bacterium]